MIQYIIEGLWKLPWKILKFIDWICHLITALLLVTYGILTGAPSTTSKDDNEGGAKQLKKDLSKKKQRRTMGRTHG